MDLPALGPGVYWATIATVPESWRYGMERPFVVADGESEARSLLERLGPCAAPKPIVACLAEHAKGPDVATTTVDMAPVLARVLEERHVLFRRGVEAVLVLGAVVETALLWFAYVRGKERVAVDEAATRAPRRSGLVMLVVSVLFTWLSFGLLALAVALVG